MADDNIFTQAMENSETPREQSAILGLLLVGKMMESNSAMSQSNQQWLLANKLQAEKALDLAYAELRNALYYVAPAGKAARIIRRALTIMAESNEIDITEELEKWTGKS